MVASYCCNAGGMRPRLLSGVGPVGGRASCGTLGVVAVNAREAYARGELTPAELKAAEDRAVSEVVVLQEELGLPVVNDGEMRRESFQSELTAACDGFTGVDVNAWLWGEWH